MEIPFQNEWIYNYFFIYLILKEISSLNFIGLVNSNTIITADHLRKTVQLGENL